MKKIVISGTGVFTPPYAISDDELVASFNKHVDEYNQAHQDDIAAGKLTALAESDAEFIIKASGIKSRYVMEKQGILATHIMFPLIKERPDDQMSMQCEMAVDAAKKAMTKAKKTAADIDAVIASCTSMQRSYPSIAIEVQNALGINGFAYDMGVACSSVTFGIQAAVTAIAAGQAKCVLIVSPEIASAQVDFGDRESHFIFGDAASAIIIEAAETCTADYPYEIVSIKLKTQFSNNIRCDFGFMNRVEQLAGAPATPKLFKQQGRKVFKEVVPLVVELINEHLAQMKIKPDELKRLWLHQANSNMNRLVGTKILGYEPSETMAPVILDKYANTGSVGVAIVFDKYHQDLAKNDLGVMCSFGAGYSIGNVILRKI